jgi:CHAD domain-containing protein
MDAFTSPDLDPADVLSALAGAGYELGTSHRVRRTVLDTFDGRLAAAGMRLELREQAGSQQLVLDAEGTTPVGLAVDGAPRFAADLPAGPFRARLLTHTDIRALLALMTVAATATRAVRRDRAGKARVAVDVHDKVTVERHDEVGPLWAVEVGELAGYAKDAAGARDLLVSLGLAGGADVLVTAAVAAGIDLTGFKGSPTVPLDRKEPARQAFRRVLANLAATIDANWQGTVDDVDPEFLHDLRVAVRRTRSVLAQGKGVLPPAVRDSYREGFGWLGAATGPARDLDVYVIEWDGYVAPLGPEGSGRLAPVLAHISGRRRAEHVALARVLRSARYRKLMTGWQGWLQGGETGDEGGGTGPAIGKVAAGRTARAQAQLLERGRSIGPETPAEVLHELRKDAKKLRYLLECFGSLYAPGPRKAFVQRLKALQDNLGEHQDAEVHASQLRDFATELHGKPGVGPDTLVAMGRLTEHLEQRRQSARDEFAQRFSAYDTKQTARTFTELVSSAGGRG